MMDGPFFAGELGWREDAIYRINEYHQLRVGGIKNDPGRFCNLKNP